MVRGDVDTTFNDGNGVPNINGAMYIDKCEAVTKEATSSWISKEGGYLKLLCSKGSVEDKEFLVQKGRLQP